MGICIGGKLGEVGMDNGRHAVQRGSCKTSNWV